MYKRKLFFWLDKLRITPQERITVAVLLILLVLLSILNLLVGRSGYVDSYDYRAVELEFEKRRAKLAEQQARIMERYQPSPEATGWSGAGTTPAPGDTTSPEFQTEERPRPEKININTADAGQLQSLPGIGPFLARRIVDHRIRNGPFRSIEALKKIKGIGNKRLDRIRDQITI